MSGEYDLTGSIREYLSLVEFGGCEFSIEVVCLNDYLSHFELYGEVVLEDAVPPSEDFTGKFQRYQEYEKYDLIGSVNERCEYLSFDEFTNGECDADAVYQDRSDYLMHYELYGLSDTEEKYVEVLKDVIPPRENFIEYESVYDYEEYDLIGAVYDYIIEYMSSEELAMGECGADFVYQESSDYLRQHEVFNGYSTYRDYVVAAF